MIWRGVTLSDLVRSQFARLEDLFDDRITLKGPPLIISAAASQSFSMALHELATNAVKYGALSNSDGRVDVEWGIRKHDGEGRRFTGVAGVRRGVPRSLRPRVRASGPPSFGT